MAEFGFGGEELEILSDEILSLNDADLQQRILLINNEVKVMQQVNLNITQIHSHHV